MLQEGNRFCPFCFEDQFDTVDAGETVDTEAPGARGDRSDTGDMAPPIHARRSLVAANEARAPLVIDFADTVQPGSEEVIHIPGPTGSADADPEIGGVRPGALWQADLPDAQGEAPWTARFGTSQGKVIGIAAVLVLLALAFMGVERTYFDDRNEAGRLRAFRADVERVQTALKRGDLSAAEQLLDELDADHADDARVQALRAAVDRRQQTQAARTEALPDTSLKTSRALRLDEAAAPPVPVAGPAPVPVSAPPPAEAPAIAVSAPARAAASVDDKDCSEALAALALCARR